MQTSIAPTLPSSFSVIAERFRRAGQMDRAIALCREGLQAHPEHLSARVTLGCALLDMGEFTEAHRELQAVLKRAPDNLAAIRGLAELHARGIDEQDAQDMEDAHDAQLLHDAELLHEAQVEEPAEHAPFVEETPVSHAPAATPSWLFAEATPPVMAPEVAVSVVPDVVPDVPPAPIFAATAEPSLMSEPLCLKSVFPAALDELDPIVEAAPQNRVAARLDPVATAAPLDELDPVMEAASLDALDPVMEAAPLDELDPVMTAAAFDDLDPIMAIAPLDELDPVMGAASMQFEIEDVIAEAEESLDFGDALDLDPPMAPRAAQAPPEPIPVPALSEGPIAVLDEWLVRVRARRSALLSEYAAS